MSLWFGTDAGHHDLYRVLIPCRCGSSSHGSTCYRQQWRQGQGQRQACSDEQQQPRQRQGQVRSLQLLLAAHSLKLSVALCQSMVAHLQARDMLSFKVCGQLKPGDMATKDAIRCLQPGAS